MAKIDEMPKAEPAKPADKADKAVPLPTATFAMVANPKYYEDRSDKSKTNGRIAYVHLTQGAFRFEASIYLETKVEQTADGRHERKAIRFSLPKGVSLLDTIPADRIDAWKDTIVDSFLAWRKETGGAVVGVRTQSAGFRSID
jgi:hypothetical protein